MTHRVSRYEEESIALSRTADARWRAFARASCGRHLPNGPATRLAGLADLLLRLARQAREAAAASDADESDAILHADVDDLVRRALTADAG